MVSLSVELGLYPGRNRQQIPRVKIPLFYNRKNVTGVQLCHHFWFGFKELVPECSDKPKNLRTGQIFYMWF